MDFSSPAFKVNIFFYSSSLFKVNFYTLKKTIIFLIFVHDFLNVIISHIQRIYLPHIRQGSSFFTLYERILKERQRLQKQIDSLQTKLSGFPSGKLICSQNGNRCKWYQSDGHTKVYIPKEEKQLAEQLASKKYLSLLLEDLSHEKRQLILISITIFRTPEERNIYSQIFPDTKSCFPHFSYQNHKNYQTG